MKSFRSDARAQFVRSAVVLSVLSLGPSAVVGAREKDHPRPAAHVAPVTAPDLAVRGWTKSSLGSIDTGVFDLALSAANCAIQTGAVDEPSTLTVIDYSKVSTAKRLWVFDLRSHELLYEELVAHGSGSGNNVATQFGNEPETHRSSIGLFKTEDTYVGKNGYSLRLNGLDAGFNDNAYERAIVMHGAPYVSEKIARAQGRLGRSWGCPALSEAVAHDVIDRVKQTGLVFAYYPDQRWLNSSKYLGGCSAPASASS